MREIYPRQSMSSLIISEAVLLLFMSFMFTHSSVLSHSFEGYLSAVRSWYLSNIGEVFDREFMYVLKRGISGWSSLRPSAHKQLCPISIHNGKFQRLMKVLPRRSLNDKCRRVVFLCQYFGCFRTGEIGLKTDDPEMLKRRLDIGSFNWKILKNAVQVSLTSEKADRFGRRESKVPIPCYCPEICAVNELKAYFKARKRAGFGRKRDPAFQLTDGSVITPYDEEMV